MAKCPSCYQENNDVAKYCTACGKAIPPIATGRRGISDRHVKPKSKTTAGILGILLGGLGAHKFYVGSWGWGIVYILFVLTYIPAIVGIIEGITILTMSDGKFDEQYNSGPSAPFKW